jgi:hypothetical protein
MSVSSAKYGDFYWIAAMAMAMDVWIVITNGAEQFASHVDTITTNDPIANLNGPIDTPWTTLE